MGAQKPWRRHMGQGGVQGGSRGESKDAGQRCFQRTLRQHTGGVPKNMNKTNISTESDGSKCGEKI